MLAFLGLFALFTTPPALAQSDVRIEPHRTRWERIETWRLRGRVDFGPEDRVEPGSEPGDALDWNPRAIWSRGMVRPGSRPDLGDAYLGDFVEGERANLDIAVDSGTMYRVILTFGDAVSSRGPVRVQVGDRVLVDSLVTKPGEFTDVRFETRAFGCSMTILLDAAPCRSFALCGAAWYSEGAPPGSARTRNARPERDLPATRADGDSLDRRAKRALGDAADYLLDAQPPEGGFSRNGAWYECAYPVRTLLAARRILDEPRYETAALECVDRFVEEQLPEGGWSAHFFGSAGCSLAQATRMEYHSRNLADVGSMALALGLAAEAAKGERAARYLTLDRAYADNIVLKAQLSSGAFPNGRWEGKELLFPYSIATAVQATHLAQLYRLTEDKRYRDAALRAALFLAGSVQSDGSVRLYPHDKDETRLLPAESVGDLFYVVESLIHVLPLAVGADADSLAGALDRYFRGGSLAPLWSDPRTWLRKGDVWERSKRAGVLYLLLGYEEIRGPSEDLSKLVQAVFGALESPAFSQSIGVRADPQSPENRYSMAATGFAGIGFAALARGEVSAARGSR
ncbi:MAG TPA: hypothetical protein VFP10_05030 [Candidatus Eisenbacteria bacterium]|nr:hypothetical protein [Candidatus Eisenbacteria bacterium]